MDNPRKWILKDVERKVLNGQDFSKEHVRMMEWNSPLKQEEMRVLTLPPSSLSPTDLYHYVKILERKDQNSFRYELAFWRKVFRPLNTGIMILVAIPFVFGPLRAATTGKRILMGSLAGLGYFLATQILEQAGGMIGFSPLMSVLAPFGSLLGVTILFWNHSF